jgi:hypothetical protein
MLPISIHFDATGTKHCSGRISVTAMAKVTLYTSGSDAMNGPEGECPEAALVEYDLQDPSSLQKAREAVRDRFGLNYLPVLCNEPEPSLFAEIGAMVGQWFARKNNARRSVTA